MRGQYCVGGLVAECSRVLVVCADLASNCGDVQSKLRDTGAFAAVDTWFAQSAGNGGSGTPSLAQLSAYHAVLAYSNIVFDDPTLLGDRLAAFHDQGGGVVVSVFANGANIGYRLQGAYGAPANGYALLNHSQGGFYYLADSLGAVLEPSSPLMTGVVSLAAQIAIRSTAPVIGGRGVVVVRWGGAGQEPLVVRGRRGNRTLVEINFWPVSSSVNSDWWTGDGAVLMRNGLKYSRCILCGVGTYAGQGAGGVGVGGAQGDDRVGYTSDMGGGRQAAAG